MAAGIHGHVYPEGDVRITTLSKFALWTVLALVLSVAGAGAARTTGFTLLTRSPIGGLTLKQPIRWEVGTSGLTPSRVDFFVDGRLRWTERLEPYRFGGDSGELQPASLGPGKHVLRAVAHVPSRTAVVTVTVFVPRASLGSKLPSRIAPSRGRKYFVDGQSGRDSNRGTLKAPWRTIGRAWRSVPIDGSVVFVRRGTYSGQVNLSNRHASASNPISVRAYPGERVTLTNPRRAYPAVYIWKSSGVRLQGFNIVNPTGDGIKVDSAADVEISGNSIHGNGMQGVLVGGSEISGQTYSRNVQIWSNRFYSNGGYSPTGDPYARVGTHSIYYGNTSSNDDGIRHGAVGGIIANNVFYDAPAGYHIQVGSQADGLVIANNTLDNAYQTDTAAGDSIAIYGEQNRFATKNVVVANNVIANSAHRGLYGSGPTMAGNTALNNLAYNNPLGDFVSRAGSSVLFTVGHGNIVGRDPRFVDRDARNYRPRRGSPVIGRADPAYAPPLDGSGRRRSGKPDIGAFEFRG